MKSRRSRSFSTKGCTALITGASAGLGAEFASQLGPVASRMILVGRREDRLEALVGSLRQKNPSLRVEAFRADLSVAAERERLAAWIVREEIPLNLLINNAGLGDLGPFDNVGWERLSPMLDVNITALTHLTHLLLPMLRAQVGESPSGILNVSSIAGFFPLPRMAVYAATKAYVTSFSEALRMELASDGVVVTALCPGPVPTEFFKVASREGEEISAMDRTNSALTTFPDAVVRDALKGLEQDKPGVIPNMFLALLVRGVRMLPFPVIRKAIEMGAGPQQPRATKKDQ